MKQKAIKVKLMNKIHLKLTPSILFFVIYFALLSYYEILLRYFTLDMKLNIMPFVFNLLYALLLTILTKSIKANRLVFFVALCLIAFVYGSQIYYYFFFGTYYIAYSFMQAGMVVGNFYREIIALVIGNLHILFAIVAPIVTLLFFSKFLKAKPWSFKKTSMAFMIFVILYGLTILQITSRSKDDTVYDAYVYHPDVVDSANILGMITSFSVDVTRLARESLGMTNAVKIPEIIVQEPTKPTSSITYNALDIPFETLIANETNPTIKAMHEYFSSQTPTKQNAKTGLYKDYNLIVITAESFSRWVVSETLTPTLYKMLHEGVYFPNFYNPLWGVSTYDSEYVQFSSLVPKSGVWSLKESAKNDMTFALGHQMKALGYTTYAFHDNDYTYFSRNLSHPNLGYTYMGVGNGLTNTGEWPQSDLDMMKETIPMFINDDKFHVYYMTVSGHCYYHWYNNSMSAKNRDLVKNLPYSEVEKAYIAANLELEKAMTYLLDELKKSGKLDHTLIVLSADHYPYVLSEASIKSLNNGVAVDYTFDIHRSPFILYNSKMVPQTITKSVSNFDILPTIANLMGVPFDSRLMMGTDIFSSTDPVVIFKDHSFISSVGRYNAKAKTFTYNDGVVKNQAYVDRMIQVIDAKFYYSQKFLENDYYKIISNSLKP